MVSLSFNQLAANYQPVGDPYGTHLNLLRALGSGIRTVLELGAGQFSTPLLLDRSAYPDLTELVTIESDPAWAATCRTSDIRHALAVLPEPIEPYLAKLDLDSFDLILCDNSSSAAMRRETLKWLSVHIGRSLVVAHDYDAYADACTGFDRAFIDDRQTPHTALLWRAK